MSEIRRELGQNYDYIDHPAHYNQGGIETIDYIKSCLTKEEYIGYLKGTVLKYISRLGKKHDDLQDAKKAMWYLNKLIQAYGRINKAELLYSRETNGKE